MNDLAIAQEVAAFQALIGTAPIEAPARTVADNSIDKVRYRELLLDRQKQMAEAIEDGKLHDELPALTLKHYFTPLDPKYGCHTYARQILLTARSLTIGRIHRHQHLNFIMQGDVIVSTEFEEKRLTAPQVFVSDAGIKRIVYALVDSIWVTVHLVRLGDEKDIEEIEDELMAPTYEDIGLISTVAELARVELRGR